MRVGAQIAIIKEGWHEAGKIGEVLGPDIFAGQFWTPVLWEGEDDPDWHKTAGLDFKYADHDKETIFVKVTIGMIEFVFLTTLSSYYKLRDLTDVDVEHMGTKYEGPYWILVPRRM